MTESKKTSTKAAPAPKKEGYEVLSDLMYEGKILQPGTRGKLENLNEKQIERLLNEKVISK